MTRNRSRILSARPRRTVPGLVVRLHECFLDAPCEVLAAVARLCRPEAPRSADRATVRSHFETHVAPPPRRRPRLRTTGHHFDLQEVFDRLNGDHFAGTITAAITWGRRPPRRRRRRSIRLGSYQAIDRVIRIHPALDAPHVPGYVLETVIHHEMLHAAFPPQETASGRRRIHTAEFRAHEQAFPAAEAARRWLDRHLESLLV